MSYVTGDFLKDDTYTQLGDHLEKLDKEQQLDGNVVFYLAAADRFFGPIVERWGKPA